MLQTHIKIANRYLILETKKNLVNIQSLFNAFKYNKEIKHNTKNKLKIIIKNASKKSVKLSRDKKTLTITGNDIDNLYNPFNLIGILQATFRFVGFHSIKNNFFLLHGSSAIFNNKAICFADDGESTAKTLSSVECALKSGKYIGDEFCFLDENYKVTSYPLIPIHIRVRVKKYLKKIYKNKMNRIFNGVLRTKAGYFIQANNIFKIVNSKKLFAFVFVYFTKKQKPYFLKLNNKESKQAILKCVSAHLIKFFHPKLDRMQFIKEKDSVKKVHYEKKIIKQIKNTLKLNGNIEYIAQKIPCYRFYMNKPKDIVYLMKKAGF